VSDDDRARLDSLDGRALDHISVNTYYGDHHGKTKGIEESGAAADTAAAVLGSALHRGARCDEPRGTGAGALVERVGEGGAAVCSRKRLRSENRHAPK
jgi:hypothetical protein